MITEEVDKGQIIKVTKIPITEDMTAIKLLRKQNAAALEDFRELMEVLFYGNETVYEQPEGTDYLHKFRDVPADGEINITWNGAQISAFLRAMDFGVLEVFGKPSFSWEGHKYHWKKYLIEKNDTVKEDKITVDADDQMILIKKSDGYIIILKGIY